MIHELNKQTRLVFRDMEPGCICTATIYALDLDARLLLEAGVIEECTIDVTTMEDARGNERYANTVNEYRFLGLHDAEGGEAAA